MDSAPTKPSSTGTNGVGNFFPPPQESPWYILYIAKHLILRDNIFFSVNEIAVMDSSLFLSCVSDFGLSVRVQPSPQVLALTDVEFLEVLAPFHDRFDPLSCHSHTAPDGKIAQFEQVEADASRGRPNASTSVPASADDPDDGLIGQVRAIGQDELLEVLEVVDAPLVEAGVGDTRASERVSRLSLLAPMTVPGLSGTIQPTILARRLSPTFRQLLRSISSNILAFSTNERMAGPLTLPQGLESLPGKRNEYISQSIICDMAVVRGKIEVLKVFVCWSVTVYVTMREILKLGKQNFQVATATKYLDEEFQEGLASCVLRRGMTVSHLVRAVEARGMSDETLHACCLGRD
ncbi:hypothetical protein KC325_g294 [Hortaea werneckii]|nr:hypothetical protein KC325_g294 [Hortaea werneckii]